MAYTFTLLGLPNSGKSSIVHCLTTDSGPIISEHAGTTVDFIKYPIKGIPQVYIADTAGYHQQFLEENKKKLEDSDFFLFVVDGADRIGEHHKLFLKNLRKMFPEKIKNALLIINKIDKVKKHGLDYSEIMSLGFSEYREISAMAKLNIKELLKYMESNIHVKELQMLEEEEEIPVVPMLIPKICILGKTNVGKSTLMNLLSCEEISIVKSTMNTTVDPVNNLIKIREKKLILQDTAGFSTEQKFRYEGLVLKRTKKALEECDIALIVTDEERGITNTDMALFGLCKRYKKGFIIVINKWDLASGDMDTYLRGRFYQHELLDVEPISCKTSYGIKNLKKKILELAGYCNSKIETSRLNNWCQKYLNLL